MTDRALDGHIQRAIEGKTVVGVSKDGVFMAIHCTNGEQFCIGWADFVSGQGFAGEPAIASFDNIHGLILAATDGSVSRALAGRTIESARTQGAVLQLQCTDGTRLGIAWLDSEGTQVRAEPCLTRVDVRVVPEGVSIINLAQSM